MKRELSQLVFTFVFAVILFYCVLYFLETNDVAITFLLCLFVTHQLLEKNQWFIDWYLSFNTEGENNDRR
ncbi:short-chain dehydrogenase [Fictibacillus sp. KIGAM418]|uniref:Short-chain dehydrogenase n=1 Tax=Fictibacillus marinisediminis TaxID=2878389 RepID=A0A9X1X8T1_9BACL|nr:short-chain dehydrogenase [Fictibacillus marinisediminis]MCK6256292.1 short-chain dehydrogenase [Fictibacillus marinisediminis]